MTQPSLFTARGDATIWEHTHKGNAIVRALADRHYTRQTVGAPSFTRPGYNAVLICRCARSGWVWWRPKWEDGRPGTARKDGLRSIECTLFRREAGCVCGPASQLIRQAVAMLPSCVGLHLGAAGSLDPDMPLITAVGVQATAARRSRRSLPGVSYRNAGWSDADPLRRPPIGGKIWLTCGGVP